MFYKQQELETFMENVGKSADQKQELKKGFYTGGAEDLLPRHHIDEDDFRCEWIIKHVQKNNKITCKYFFDDETCLQGTCFFSFEAHLRDHKFCPV